MALRNPVIGGLTQRGSFSLEVVAATSFELLSAIHALTSPSRGATWGPESVDACPPRTRAALEAVNDPTGDLWLQLLGTAYEVGSTDAQTFVRHVREMKPLDLRLRLLGRWVPSWCRQLGAETIERAARGDAAAKRRVEREAPEYCADSAASFAAILPLGAAETKRRIVSALAAFEEEVLHPSTHALQRQLLADAEAKRELVATTDPYELIESASGGFRYEHESTVKRVVLIPHLAGAPAVLLAEHRESYLIAYPIAAEVGRGAALQRIGHALDDSSRVAILIHLGNGEATLTELADAADIAKSTAHHHLVLLRAAGLVTARGNAQGRSYALDTSGIEAASRLLGSIAPT